MRLRRGDFYPFDLVCASGMGVWPAYSGRPHDVGHAGGGDVSLEVSNERERRSRAKCA